MTTQAQVRELTALIERLRRPHPAPIGPYGCICVICEARFEAATALARLLRAQARLRKVVAAEGHRSHCLASGGGNMADCECWVGEALAGTTED